MANSAVHCAVERMDNAGLHSALLERLRVGVIVWRVAEDDAGKATLIAANPAASTLTGLDFTVWLGASLRERCPAAIAAGRHEVYAAVAGSGAQLSFDAARYPELGNALLSGLLVGLPERHVGVVFDDAARPGAANDSTLRLNAFLDSIVDNIPTMVFVKDAEHLRYELTNRAGELLTGWKRQDILGKDDYEVFPKEAAFFQEKDRDVLREGRLLDIPEEPIDTPHGRRWLHTKKIPILKPDGTPGHLLGISIDITERKLAVEALERAHVELERRVAERTSELVEANARLTREMNERQRAQEALQVAEEQLRHSQKMEAVGRLAGGVAHDFNNLLSVILSYTSILSEGQDPQNHVAEGLAQIRKASERAADLTRQLLAFSRQQVLAPRVVDLNVVIDGMGRMLRRVIGEDLELKIVQAPGIGRVKADPGQLEQVIMNLVVNARDAMPSGGRLTLQTENVELDESYARDHVGVSAGAYVMLAVIDTGTGMDKATLGRVFEPFFTTKKLGKGTGLGLSTVFGIVKQSGGHISAESVLTRGSSFRIYFARTAEEVTSAPPTDGVTQARGGSETLLLVEDEEQVRVIARDILCGQGYRVLDAASPSEALSLSDAYGSPIDLLVTDVIMPEMNGRVLSERLRAQRPELEVLFMSGYTDKALEPDGVLAPGAAFLQKPITPLTLAAAVRRILDARQPGKSASA
jgi:PAS domain S-box-containing protein